MTIPISSIVSTNPGVIGTGGIPLAMNGVVLSRSPLLRTGEVQSFDSADSVSSFFGSTSAEKVKVSDNYFLGFDGSPTKPNNLIFAPFNAEARAAWLQSAALPALAADITQVQRIRGGLAIRVDGITRTIDNINLATASSQSAAASMIQTALNASLAVEATATAGTVGASFTGTLGATFTATATGTSLAVTAVTGFIAIGDFVAGTGITAGTYIVSQNAGGTPNGAGTYILSQTATSSSQTLTCFGNVLDVTDIAWGTLFAGDALSGVVPTGAKIVAQLAGTAGSTGQYQISIGATTYAASGTVTDTSLIMVVDGTLTGIFGAGQTITTTHVTTGPFIRSQLSIIGGGSAGGLGTYRLSSAANTQAAEALTATATAVTVAWMPVQQAFQIVSGCTGLASTIACATGTCAAPLGLTSATGSTLSQGATADTEASALANVVANTTNWANFMTMWEPDITSKQAFAAANNAMNQRYGYICWDTDGQAIVNGSETCFGVVAKGLGWNGIFVLYNTIHLAAFILGVMPSLDFNRTNGRITLAFKSQAGMTPTVLNRQIADNLLVNGYSFYGVYAEGLDQFKFIYNGQSPGAWKWFDTYQNQIYLNFQFRLALISLLTTINRVPYNQIGFGEVRAAMMDPINQAVNFGTITPGVQLSQAQIAEVNIAAGVDIASTLQNTGWYLQIKDPGAQVRGQRGSFIINFWYTDGGAVQSLSIASTDVM